MKSRPHIPITVRLQVIERQLLSSGKWTVVHAGIMRDSPAPPKARLAFMIEQMFGHGEKPHLDHEPQLALRPYNPRVKDVAARFTPNANDPGALIYRTRHAHHIKSNVRGDHGQLSDTALRVKRRKIERRLAGKPKRNAKIPARVNPWPTGRKFQTRSKGDGTKEKH